MDRATHLERLCLGSCIHKNWCNNRHSSFYLADIIKINKIIKGARTYGNKYIKPRQDCSHYDDEQ